MLPAYRTILVTTDLTPNSEHAFKHAVVLARQTDAKIHLLHVVPEIDATFRTYVSAVMGEGKLAKFEKTHEEEAREEVRQELDHLARTELKNHPEDLDRFAGTIVLHGHPVPQILKTADVIVMGTHGKGALEYTFLGSTAEKVLRKSKRPVFVVPLPA
ncbi:nucleotide-binding universal stress UspA family protein [Geothermobacter ehrlichii]|uniref:Nucleotide-binding universal stress UspA family protein n=1 Tax=Geothermobacter ehrlichii TaxID=213224 RepID=A0A5D3WGG2_9BACT|nr:universal stress protein [Geothermobacter ehrlichii]TYO95664.1 nucleotide-binding universal stress UspA family protein [Geothermobacter ehrlichii]